MQNIGGAKEEAPAPVAANPTPAPKADVDVPKDGNVDIDVDSNQASTMVSYDVTTIGRADPLCLLMKFKPLRMLKIQHC